MLITQHLPSVPHCRTQIQGDLFHVERVIGTTITAIAGEDMNACARKLTHNRQPAGTANRVHCDQTGGRGRLRSDQCAKDRNNVLCTTVGLFKPRLFNTHYGEWLSDYFFCHDDHLLKASPGYPTGTRTRTLHLSISSVKVIFFRLI